MKNLAAILTFIVLAFGLAWLVTIPAWRGEGLHDRLFLPLTVAMMYTPMIAAFVTGKLFEPRTKLLPVFGITVFNGRIVLWCLLAILASLVINLGALAVGQAFGVFHLDLVHFSAFQAIIDAKLAAVHKPMPANMPPLSLLVLIQLVVVVIAAPLNAIAAVGEEIGWRGFLLPRLLPMGWLPASIAVAVIWGLWHAPVILLGYNYPEGPRWLALACMCGMCFGLGLCLAWLRLTTRSIWPCAIFHGAINAGAGFYAVLGMAGDKVDFTQATLLGWTGWIIPAVLGMLLFVLFPPKPQPSDQTASSLPDGSVN